MLSGAFPVRSRSQIQIREAAANFGPGIFFRGERTKFLNKMPTADIRMQPVNVKNSKCILSAILLGSAQDGIIVSGDIFELLLIDG